jgi:hypothetical protein
VSQREYYRYRFEPANPDRIAALMTAKKPIVELLWREGAEEVDNCVRVTPAVKSIKEAHL